jgi:hypothetical protein
VKFTMDDEGAFQERYKFVFNPDRPTDVFLMRALLRAAEKPADDAPVVLGRVAPPTGVGIMLEGIATTRCWDEGESPLAAGLVTLDGRTTRRTVGRDPRKMQGAMPVPVWWHHEPGTLLGQMFEAVVDGDVVRFRAEVVPPGTAGYVDVAVKQAWDAVRSGEVGAVSLTASVAADGSWRPVELSLCAQGANPVAIITRATFPDGHVVERPELKFSERIVREANAAHREAWRRKRAGSKAGASPPLSYRGVWRAGMACEPGFAVTDKGALWFCWTATKDRPGTGDSWQLMHKSA